MIVCVFNQTCETLLEMLTSIPRWCQRTASTLSSLLQLGKREKQEAMLAGQGLGACESLNKNRLETAPMVCNTDFVKHAHN